MATAIAQKSYKALFPLWSLKKKDILKLINSKSRRRKIERIGKNLDIETKILNIETKKKVKIILILSCMNSKKVTNFVFGSI